MTPYKNLGDLFDDLARFGREWVNEYAEKEIAIYSDLDSSCGSDEK